MNEIQGSMNGENLKIAIVTSEFNGFITEQLLKGAEHTLLKYGVTASNIDSLHVPGAFELPLAAKKLSSTLTCCAGAFCPCAEAWLLVLDALLFVTLACVPALARVDEAACWLSLKAALLELELFSEEAALSLCDL